MSDAGVVVVALETGGTTLVDAADRWRLRKYLYYRAARGYAVRHTYERGEKRVYYLHREILGLSHGDPRQGDHLNHDKLDNRRANLRICSHAENQQNRRGANRNSTSGIRGVGWDSENSRWRARIGANGVVHDLGRFTHKEDAARAVASFMEGETGDGRPADD